MTGATTSITIEITTPDRTPVRRHVSIPPGDQLTQDWFDIQKNQSASVRLLIAEEIRRHGMVDRVTRERFGTPLAQAAARAAQRTANRAAAAAPAAGSAFTAPTVPAASAATAVPTPWVVPLLDPKDAEIQRLNDLIAERETELSSLRQLVDPAGAFHDALEREGITEDGLLI